MKYRWQRRFRWQPGTPRHPAPIAFERRTAHYFPVFAPASALAACHTL